MTNSCLSYFRTYCWQCPLSLQRVNFYSLQVCRYKNAWNRSSKKLFQGIRSCRSTSRTGRQTKKLSSARNLSRNVHDMNKREDFHQQKTESLKGIILLSLYECAVYVTTYAVFNPQTCAEVISLFNNENPPIKQKAKFWVIYLSSYLREHKTGKRKNYDKKSL